MSMPIESLCYTKMVQNFVKKWITKTGTGTKKAEQTLKQWDNLCTVVERYQQADTICMEKQLLREKCESVNVARIAFLCFLCNWYHYAT